LSAGVAGRVELNVGAQSGATQAATGQITGGKLLLLGSGTLGTFTLTSTLNNVDVLAAATNAAINYRDADALVIGTVVSAGVNTSGHNVTLTVGGLLTVGSGAGEDMTATGATVDIIAASTTEGAGSIITAANLRLQGAGTFTLTQANQVATLAAV